MTCTGLEVDTQTLLETQPRGLSVWFPDGREQKLPLPQTKATLGAGAGCTVLIRHPGVGALHCILIPTNTGWRVRRWSGNTLLNGEVFTEAPVEAGDRLQLGPVEVEFLVEEPEQANVGTTANSVGGCGSSAAWKTNGNHPPAVLDNSALADRAGLNETLAEHLARLEELTQRLHENAENQQRSQQQLDELRAQLHDLRHELAHAEQLHVATREAIVELERQIADVRQSPVAKDEVLFVPEPKLAASPASFFEKYGHLLREDEAAGSERAEATSESKSRATEPPAPDSNIVIQETCHASAGHEDDSIESYMARLLQRVRGESSPVATAIVPQPVSAVDSSSDTSTASSDSEIEAPQPVVKPVTDLCEIKAAPAPERSRDMGALRDLANQSARSAIRTAKMKKQRENALVKLLVSLLAIICGLIVMKMAPSYVSPEFISGLVPMIAGLVWGCRTIVLLYAIRGGSFAIPFTPDPSDEESAPIPPDLSADDL